MPPGACMLCDQEPKALIGQTRRMLQLARPESALIGGAMGLLLGSTAISLAVPKVMGGLIDSAMQSNGACALHLLLEDDRPWPPPSRVATGGRLLVGLF